MAHHSLKGSKKPRLTRIKTKHKDKNKQAKKVKGTKGQPAAAGASAAPQEESGAGGRKAPNNGMNKKEARALAALEKAHRDLYSKDERILLVGEGNFSFAHSLCKHLGSGAGVYATSFDSEAELKRKYEDAGENRNEIEESYGGTCLTGVDCMRIHKVKEFKGAFKKIVFNFPHMGSGEKDVEKNIAQHRQLLAAFFVSAAKCLDGKQDSSIHVALKTGEPYKSWKVVQTARAACPELTLLTATPFMSAAFEGYAHRRTAGFSKFSNSSSEELAKGSKVFVFRKPRRQQKDDDDDDA